VRPRNIYIIYGKITVKDQQNHGRVKNRKYHGKITVYTSIHYPQIV